VIEALTCTRPGQPYLPQQDDDGEQVGNISQKPENIHFVGLRLLEVAKMAEMTWPQLLLG